MPTKQQSTDKPRLLPPLPNPNHPNVRIHTDLFGPMLAAGHQHKHILCITDRCMKYALIMAIENKEAETVAKAIFNKWFCKFGILEQIHTDGRKDFVNKFSNELFTLLNVQHTKTTPANPQCNAQVEVFNKTVKKYLASFIDNAGLGKLLTGTNALLQHWLPLHHHYDTVRATVRRETKVAIISKSRSNDSISASQHRRCATNFYKRSDLLLETLPMIKVKKSRTNLIKLLSHMISKLTIWSGLTN
jgi:hypothetical protein